jgi:flagellar motility protein MotE (MotC chaperone)
MAPRPESIGTQGNKRGSCNKAWKKFSLRSNFYVTTLVLFFLLLAVKVVISGIFLKTSPLDIASADAAMAQELTAKEDQNLGDLEHKLRDREKELLKKEAELKKMEAQLLPLKEEVETRMAELNDLQISLAAEAKKLAEREKALEDGKITHLVQLYSSMEAGKAAAILDKLQLDIVVRILGNMKGKSAGEIMGMMTPDKGATISKKLSEVE